MKKLTALLLSLILVFSLCSVSAFAEEQEQELSDRELTATFITAVLSMYDRSLITREECFNAFNSINFDRLHDKGFIHDNLYDLVVSMIDVLSANLSKTSSNTDLPNEYSFGQGTFIVGQDLKAGTYDVTCETSSGGDLDSSMAGLSDFYASQGMNDYADMIDSMSGMYGSIGGMTVKTYKAGVSYSDQYLTLKSGETARIILEDGGKIEISDGTAKLVWIR